MRKHLTLVTFITVLTVFIVALGTAHALAQEAVRNGEITAIAADTQSFTVKTARGETNVVTTDVFTANGVIHVVDKVLIPAP